MGHRNARLTPITRLELVQEVADGWSQAEVARQFRVSRPTVQRWVRRYRRHGEAGLEDRSSAPHRHPRRTPPELEQRICAVRRQSEFGPHRIAWVLGLARSTVYAVLRRAGLHRLDRLHRVTRRVVRYEHPVPGDLLHIDIKKLGRIPHGGGHRVLGRSSTTPRGRGAGLDYLHVAVDDHSRYAYVEALPDERAPGLRRLPRPRRRPLPGARRARAPGAHRQRDELRLPCLPPGRGDARRHAQADTSLPPADQRQGRALHPYAALGVGLPLRLPHERAPRPRSPGIPAVVQQTQTPRLARRPPPISRVSHVRGQYS